MPWCLSARVCRWLCTSVTVRMWQRSCAQITMPCDELERLQEDNHSSSSNKMHERHEINSNGLLLSACKPHWLKSARPPTTPQAKCIICRFANEAQKCQIHRAEQLYCRNIKETPYKCESAANRSFHISFLRWPSVFGQQDLRNGKKNL